MSLAIAAFRSNRAVVLSVVMAAAAVTLLALIGVAKLLGWIPSKPAVSRPMSAAPSAKPMASSATDLGLAPGETLVVPADNATRPAPMMPHYGAPPAPAPAPAVAAAAAAEDKSATPSPASTPATRPPERHKLRTAHPEPRTPSFARGAEHPTSPLDTWPNPAPCERCGRVVATTTWPDMAEVRIQFEDGSTRTLRSSAPSPWHVGDRVRVEHGRLLKD